MATTPAENVISEQVLRDELKRVEPRAFLVPLRILRRVIRAENKLRGLWLGIPHRKSWVLSRERATELLAPDELGLATSAEFPATLILLIGPEPLRLTWEQACQRYWRLLYHSLIHLNLDQAHLDEAEIRARIHSIGEMPFEEIRNVLEQERFLLPGASDRAVYVEFAAVYLELYSFAPHAIRAYFPSLGDHQVIASILRTDVDYSALLTHSNLGGVDLPPPLIHDEFDPDEERVDTVETSTLDDRTAEWRWQRMMDRAEQHLEAGNSVAAARLRIRSLAFAPRAERARTEAAAKSALETLVRRLKAALSLSDTDSLRWRRALTPLLDRSAHGLWPREARLLYELQKIAVEKEKEVYSIDLIGWVFSLGKRPLKRPLPHHREVRAVQHLRHALELLRRVHVLETDRQRLGWLLNEAIHRAETELRREFRPILVQSFDSTGLIPATVTERAARRKVIEELLDHIVERGFLRFGNVRDALSRNQLKMHDLSGPGEFLRGDQLLRLDRQLAIALEGVYHRGEIYMRALQRLSSLLFGTPVGRFVTRFAILPVGGAFVILEGLKHLVNIFVHIYDGVEPEFLNPVTWTIISLAIMLGVNFRRYRVVLWTSTKRVARGIWFVLHDIPLAILDFPPIRTVLDSKLWSLFWRWVLRPVGIAGLAWLIWPTHLYEFPAEWHSRNANLLKLGLVVVLSLLMNSRAGRDAEEIVEERLALIGRQLRVSLLPELVRFVVKVFSMAVEAFEQLLYSVDEMLRFRSGQSTFLLVVKAATGLVWAVITYVARIYVNLLIEPQINPIKHFPVVTVSHKVILPMTPQLYRILRTPFMPLGLVVANAAGVVTVFLLPGVFGFLVWEFKENWKLYESNRPERLIPEMVGHHGETIRGFLRPGFHSGTIPSLYARWRKAERKAQRRGRPALARKPRELLHHTEQSIRRFIDRAIVTLIEESRVLEHDRMRVGLIHLCTNQIHVELHYEGSESWPAEVVFEERGGVLTGRLESWGWMAHLPDRIKHAIANALVGLFAMGEVERLHGGQPQQFENFEVPWHEWTRTWESDVIQETEHPVPLIRGCELFPSGGHEELG